jgi:predicted MFS family arabinose efflux permease
MACNAYIADVTNPKNRTKRVAFMTGLLPIGFNLGKALSGVIKDELGFMYNFGLGMAVSVLTALYVIIFVPDSIRIREKRLRKEAENLSVTGGADLEAVIAKSEAAEARASDSVGTKFKNLFDITNIKDGVR